MLSKPNQSLLKVLFTFILIFFASLSYPKDLYSEDAVSDLQNKINEYTQKLTELTKAKDTLANQIRLLNSQIELTSLKINQTESTITSLKTEIAQLSVKINQLDITLNQLSSIYIHQINENYKLQKRVPVLAFFVTNNFNSFLEQYKYISAIQKNSQNTLVNMETTRTTFDLQKEEKKRKQTELEVLQKKLDEQQASLAKQKKDKSNLMEVTKNDESRYQQLRRAAEDELNSLLKAQFVGKKTVKKGDALGLMGNTGYSFGDHLHFGLYNLKETDVSKWSYANDIDPYDYLKSHRWPMNNYEITQERGATKYAYLYADRFHHGVDMVSSNKTIVAVEEGVAYFFRNPGSSLGNHVKLFHPDGKMSLYLHMQ